MKIYPTSIVTCTKNAFSRIKQTFSPAKLKTRLCNTFERVAHVCCEQEAGTLTFPRGSEIKNHQSVGASKIHIMDFLTNPKSRFKTNPELRKPMEKFISATDRQIKSTPPLKEPITVWVGRCEHPASKRLNADFAIVSNAKVGDIITPNAGYTQAHASQTYAIAEEHAFKQGKKMIYEIILPENTQVSRCPDSDGNVIIPRGASYQVLEKTTDKNGCERVKMKYILPEK